MHVQHVHCTTFPNGGHSYRVTIHLTETEVIKIISLEWLGAFEYSAEIKMNRNGNLIAITIGGGKPESLGIKTKDEAGVWAYNVLENLLK